MIEIVHRAAHCVPEHPMIELVKKQKKGNLQHVSYLFLLLSMSLLF